MMSSWHQALADHWFSVDWGNNWAAEMEVQFTKY